MVEWYVYAIGASVFMAITTLLQKKTLKKERSLEFSGVLSLFAIVIMIPLVMKVNWDYNLELYFWMFVASLFSTIGYILVIKAIRHMHVSEVSPFFTFQPGIVAILAFFFLGEALAGKQIVGIIIIILGAYALEADHTLKHMIRPFKKICRSKYIHIILVGILFYSLSGIVTKYALNISGIDAISWIFIAQLFIAFNFLVYIKISQGSLKTIKHGIKDAGFSIFLVALFSVAQRIMTISAMGLAYYSLVSPIKRTSSLFSTIIGGKIYHEKGIFLKAVACMIMLLGAYMVIMV